MTSRSKHRYGLENLLALHHQSYNPTHQIPRSSFQTSIILISNWLCKQIIAFAPDRAQALPAVIFKFPNSNRLISTSRLSTLRCVHLKPINVIISHVSQTIPNLGVGFPLRCFQRLSIPNIATLRCPWQDSRYTRGSFTSVLSY